MIDVIMNERISTDNPYAYPIVLKIAYPIFFVNPIVLKIAMYIQVHEK
jgi:hypothetical protein